MSRACFAALLAVLLVGGPAWGDEGAVDVSSLGEAPALGELPHPADGSTSTAVAGVRDCAAPTCGSTCPECSCEIRVRREPIWKTTQVPIYETRHETIYRLVDAPIYAWREVPRFKERKVPVFKRQEVPIEGKRTVPVYEERQIPIVEHKRFPCLECVEVPVYETRWRQEERTVERPTYDTYKRPVYGPKKVPLYETIHVPMYATKKVPIYKTKREPIYEETCVATQATREVQEFHPGCDERGCPQCVAQPPTREAYVSGACAEKRIVGYREVKEKCGEREVVVQTGTRPERRLVGHDFDQGVVGCVDVQCPTCSERVVEKGGWYAERVKVGVRAQMVERGWDTDAGRVVGHTTKRDVVGCASDCFDAGTTVRKVFAGWRVEKVPDGTESQQIQIGTEKRRCACGTREVRVCVGHREELARAGWREIRESVGPLPPERPACSTCSPCAAGGAGK